MPNNKKHETLNAIVVDGKGPVIIYNLDKFILYPVLNKIANLDAMFIFSFKILHPTLLIDIKHLLNSFFLVLLLCHC